MNDPRVQAMLQTSRPNKLSIFILKKTFYKLPRRIIRDKGNIYHIFKPDNVSDVQNLYQDKASMDMRLNEFKYLTSTCCSGNYQPLTIDMAREIYKGRF